MTIGRRGRLKWSLICHPTDIWLGYGLGMSLAQRLDATNNGATAGGLLAKLVAPHTFKVNSLHAQAIDRLAPPLHADAVAPDGTIEAVSMPGAKGFLLGLQWHPEWRWRESDVSRAILGAFGEALRGARP